jgi:hypothetical protein
MAKATTKIYGNGDVVLNANRPVSVAEASRMTGLPAQEIEQLRDGGKIECPPPNTVPAGQVNLGRYKDASGKFQHGLIEIVAS